MTGRVICLVCLAACTADVASRAGQSPDAAAPVRQAPAPDAPMLIGSDADIDAPPGCQEDASAYTPYSGSGPFATGTVTDYPWKGTASAYPDGDEDFTGYGSAATMVECSSTKGMRTYLDVTDGCLQATPVGTYMRGQIGAASDDAFRAVALGHPTNDPDDPVKWTDMATEYRFYYSVTHGTTNDPGFKAFLRYNTEDDLYVASWRRDGVAQIQRKQCGAYTELVIDNQWGSPSLNTWHTIRFTAVGDVLSLYLDGKLAVTATDDTWASGTAGIRVDAMDGAYIDDWRVFAP